MRDLSPRGRERERAGLLSASTMSAGDADSVALQMPCMGHILVEYLQGRCCLLWAADPPPPQAFDLFGSAAAFDAATEARPRCAPWTLPTMLATDVRP